MTTQNFDIDRILDGMAAINKEKAEIKLILQMICPYLHKVAWTAWPMPEDTPHTIISVEAEGRSLEFIVKYHERKAAFHLECINRGNPSGEKYTILWGCDYGNPTFTSEGLNGRTADLCRHQLLGALIGKLAEYNLDDFNRKIDEFYAAAGRR